MDSWTIDRAEWDEFLAWRDAEKARKAEVEKINRFCHEAVLKLEALNADLAARRALQESVLSGNRPAVEAASAEDIERLRRLGFGQALKRLGY